MEKFQPGEQIAAHVPGLTVVHADVDDGGNTTWLSLTYKDHLRTFDLALPVGTGIRFERMTPADGEPQPGELWRDQIGNLYAARKSHDGTELINVDDQSSSELWQAVHQGEYGPINRAATRPHPTSWAGGAS